MDIKPNLISVWRICVISAHRARGPLRKPGIPSVKLITKKNWLFLSFISSCYLFTKFSVFLVHGRKHSATSQDRTNITLVMVTLANSQNITTHKISLFLLRLLTLFFFLIFSREEFGPMRRWNVRLKHWRRSTNQRLSPAGQFTTRGLMLCTSASLRTNSVTLTGTTAMLYGKYLMPPTSTRVQLLPASKSGLVLQFGLDFKA